ncbi:MAG: flavodoxin family protein [Methanomicrobiaceae archaeon]|nr:flavodoxin family protein [Methanomicrobiaceae archaeon]
MQEGAVRLLSTVVGTAPDAFRIELFGEDCGDIYPGMKRYRILITRNEEVVYVYTSNSYEFPPDALLHAEETAKAMFHRLAGDVARHPERYLTRRPSAAMRGTKITADAVILQGSPRRHGNSAILAAWCADACTAINRTSHIFYLQEMRIAACTGCYACYNEGYCPTDDDMPAILNAVEHASLLVICSPVYTNTVPAGLKCVIDRFQALHARRSMTGAPAAGTGLLIAVAGRRGREHFDCVGKVTRACMQNIGIAPAEEILIDGIDEIRDVRLIPDLEAGVKSAVRSLLKPA